MLETLFNPIYTTNFTFLSYIICTVTSLVLGLIIALSSGFKSRQSRSFLLSLFLLPAIVQTVIMLVNGSVGTGIAVMGAFSLANDSTNILSDSSSYSPTIDDSTVDSAIFSKADLAINGSVSLTVNGNYKHGIVSKDDLIITGGIILVSGPENSGNGALDYNTSASITGGTLIALGSSGMSQSITGDGQCTIMTDITSQSGDTTFALCDSNSNVIASFKPAKQYTSVVVSSPSIKTGESYKIVCGGTIDGADENGFADNGKLTSGTEITEITMSEENYSSGGSMQGGGMKGGHGGMMPR